MVERLEAQAELVRINGISITNVTMDDAIETIFDAVERGERRFICFLNAHCVNVGASDSEYKAIMNRDDVIVFGDGAGVRLAGKLSGQPIRENVNGTDMFPLLCERAGERGKSLYLLGARPEIPEEAGRRMVERVPSLKIAGTRHGYFNASETDEVIEQINEAKADLLLVALGVPRQEKWIAAHRDRLNPTVVMGVGGLFDYYSGRIPRAPRILRVTSLEWVWRLAMEPGRMWKRYLVGNVVFVCRVFWWTLRGTIKK